MKDCTDRDQIIYNMWEKERMGFKQIAKYPLPSHLSLNRIRNIVYGGRNRLNTKHQQEIYRTFRLKFLETNNINKAIYYTFNNQPKHHIGEKQIRKIINRILKKKQLPNGKLPNYPIP